MKKHVLATALSHFIWGVLPLFWNLLSGVSPYFLLCMRIIFSLLFALIITVAKKESVKLLSLVKEDVNEMRLLVFAGITVAINWGAYIMATTTGRIIDSSIAYFLSPILTVLIGFIFYKERISPSQKIALIIASAGIIVAVAKSGTFPILAIVIALSFSVYNAIKKNVSVKGELAVSIEAAVTVLPALVYSIFFISSPQSHYVTTYQWYLMPLCGVATLAPLLLFGFGVKGVPLYLSGVLMYINPTMQFICGAVILKKEISETNIIILSSLALAILFFVAGPMIESKIKAKKERSNASQ